MPPLSRDTFTALFAALSPREAREFVAALYDARGWETTIEDSIIIAETNGRTRRFALAGTGNADAERLTPADIYSLALFAVDREVCESLFREYFDRSLPADGPTWTVDHPMDTETAPQPPAQSPGRSRRLVVAGVAVLVVLVAGAAGFVALDTGGADTAGTLASGSTGRDQPVTTVQRSGGDSVIGESSPPGLDETGITDASRLAAAHAQAVANTTYTWEITYRVVRDGDRTLGREVVRVGGPRTYSTTIERTGNGSLQTPYIADSAVYGNGSVEWVDDVHSRCRQDVRNASGYATRAEHYVRWLLSVNESWIFDRFRRDGLTYYSVQLKGDPWSGIRNSSGSVLLDAQGRIHAIRRVGDRPDGSHVAVTLQYRRFGNTTVDAPAWFNRTTSIGACHGNPQT